MQPIKFTEREKQILDLVSKGLQRKIIAVKLNMSLPTLDTHLRSVRQKTETHSLPELMHWIWSVDSVLNNKEGRTASDRD